MKDHNAEAERLIAYAESPGPGSPEIAANHLAAAGVHATLYLAEQQRVANLIAMSKSTLQSESTILQALKDIILGVGYEELLDDEDRVKLGLEVAS